jgi:hypothetical protein
VTRLVVQPKKKKATTKATWKKPQATTHAKETLCFLLFFVA